MTPSKRKADDPPGDPGSKRSRSHAASQFASPRDMCPRIVKLPSSPDMPVTRAGCRFDDLHHGISASESAQAFIQHLLQQKLGGRDVRSHHEADPSRSLDNFLQALTILGSAEQLTISRSPEAAAGDAMKVRIDGAAPSDVNVWY
jgi:hypothetical protein